MGPDDPAVYDNDDDFDYDPFGWPGGLDEP